jgi:hypothetical protein
MLTKSHKIWLIIEEDKGGRNNDIKFNSKGKSWFNYRIDIAAISIAWKWA